MKFGRFRVDGYEYQGRLTADRLYVVEGDLFGGDYRVTRAWYPVDRVQVLAPSHPTNYWGIGENYKVHVDFRIEEMGDVIVQRAGRFTPWFKPAGALTNPGDPLIIPVDCPVLEYEGELCVVIGKRASRVSVAEAPHHIFGYTVSNDIDGGGEWHFGGLWKQKSCDTLGPVGPWIETEVDPHGLEIITRVDGREEDRGSTREQGAQLLPDRERHQSVLHPAPGRPHHHRRAGPDPRAETGRGGGGGDPRYLRAPQPCHRRPERVTECVRTATEANRTHENRPVFGSGLRVPRQRRGRHPARHPGLDLRGALGHGPQFSAGPGDPAAAHPPGELLEHRAQLPAPPGRPGGGGVWRRAARAGEEVQPVFQRQRRLHRRDRRGGAHPAGLPDFIDYEGELCIVIGKSARRVAVADAPAYILGYTIANDIGAGPGWFKSDFTSWRTKASDSFAPVGPWIATSLDPHDLEIIVRVDGREEQRGSTRDMLRNCYEVVSGISRYCTLHPGDLISTGSPSPTRPLRAGEVVEVEIPPIGVLRNPVAAA